MTKIIIDKDPSANLDYKIDWELWLAGDTISSSQWTVATGVTKGSETNTTTTATVWISGGTAGSRYTITNRITTAAGRIDERSIILRVLDR